MPAEPEPATEAIDAVGHIVRTPGVMSGRPRIAGSRIRVVDVAGWHLQGGMSLDEMLDEFPGVTAADLHAAMAYYYDHKSEIEADEAADDELLEQLRREFPDRVVDHRK
jgi:uncharacterized protein (DUF433 family)